MHASVGPRPMESLLREWFPDLIKALGIGVMSIIVWIIKQFGDSYISSLKEIAEKQDAILEKQSDMDKRLAVLEYQAKINP